MDGVGIDQDWCVGSQEVVRINPRLGRRFLGVDNTWRRSGNPLKRRAHNLLMKDNRIEDWGQSNSSE